MLTLALAIIRIFVSPLGADGGTAAQTIRCQAGVPVTVGFLARALPVGESDPASIPTVEEAVDY